MPSPASELFRKNLVAVLRERGMSQNELAEMIGTSRPAISKIISGVEGVTLDRADRIATALDFTLSELLEEKLRIPVKTS